MLELASKLRHAWLWLNGMTNTYEYQRGRRMTMYSNLLNEELQKRTHNKEYNVYVIRACCAYLNTKPTTTITAAMQTAKESFTSAITKAI